jgi:hypothetical protein
MRAVDRAERESSRFLASLRLPSGFFKSHCQGIKTPGDAKSNHSFVRFVSCFLGATMFCYGCCIPIQLVSDCGSWFVAASRSGVVSEGCDKGSCCTAYCFVDKNGVHHCVPRPGDSCKCGISSSNSAAKSILLLTVVALPELENLPPVFLPTTRIFESHRLFKNLDHSVPTPPPRSVPS